MTNNFNINGQNGTFFKKLFRNYLPNSWFSYFSLSRLDKPIGIWLALLPCIHSLIKSGNSPILNFKRIFIFSLGTILMRSIGCTINDISDRKFDQYVSRTRNRPLANKKLKKKQAIIFLVIQLFLCSSFLFFINEKTRFLALILLPIVFIYPLCKRFTYWPQVVLGICFNWGMLMAWTDTKNFIPFHAILSWLGAVFWQIGYDTIYAYVDLEDDKKLEIFSTALLFQEQGKYWISFFYSITILLWIFEGLMARYNLTHYIILVIIASHFIYQILTFDTKNSFKNFVLFRSNIWIGFFLVISAFLVVN